MNEKTISELLEFSVIIIDKPSGPTSAHVSDFIRTILGAKRAGHCGTLDPAVSGVLPITLNRACKLSSYFTGKNKKYVGVMRLHEEASDSEVKKYMKKFVGDITQMPPVRSSVKRALRTRNVMSFDFLERDGKDVLFSAEVEAGTYIRTLVNDLGKALGGAHMLELRRIQAGIFTEEKSANLYDVEKAIEEYRKGNEEKLRALLIPAEEALKNIMPHVLIKKDNLNKILVGKPIHYTDLTKKTSFANETRVAIFCGMQFVEVARVVNTDDVFAVPEFVFN
jgi:H/ACA ribonucleoprotein complex subunit 4